MEAVCRRDPTHTPPQADCLCGIYAVQDYLDVKFRSDEVHAAIIWNNTTLWRTSEMPAVVVGRVALEGARYLPIQAAPGVIAPEWRARRATITELFVPLYAGDWNAAELGSLLARNYGVRVGVGSRPVGKRERNAKPAWIDTPNVDLGVPRVLGALREVLSGTQAG